MSVNPWDTCFLCRSRDVVEINSPDDSKTVKPSYESLVKYLINGYNDEVKQKSSDLPQLISKVTVNQSPVWKVKLCCRCDEVAQVIQNLKVKIETLQRNLTNVIQTFRKTVAIGTELDIVEEKDDVASQEYFQVLRNFQSQINRNKDEKILASKIFSLSSGENTSDCLKSAPSVEVKVEPVDKRKENDDFHDSETTPYETVTHTDEPFDDNSNDDFDFHHSWSVPYVAVQTEDEPECPPASSQQEPVNMTEEIAPSPPLPLLKNPKRKSHQQPLRKSKRKAATTPDDAWKPLSNKFARSIDEKHLATSSVALTLQSRRKMPLNRKPKPTETLKSSLPKSKSEAKQNPSEPYWAILDDDTAPSDFEDSDRIERKERKDKDYSPDKHDIKRFKESISGWQPNLKPDNETPSRSTRATRASGLTSPDEPFTSEVILSRKPPVPPKISRKGRVPPDLTPAQKLAQFRKSLVKRRAVIPQCGTCGGRFKGDICSFEHHLRSHETSEKKYTCPDCQIGFSTSQLFSIHLTAHYGAKYSCDICSERFYRLDLNKHLLQTHPGNFYQCPFCCSAFGKFESLAVHMIHHRGLKLRCDLCQPNGDEVSFGRLQLLQHLHESHNLTDFMLACDEPDCSETFYEQTAKKLHMNVHLATYRCKFCAKCFKNSNTLDQHLLIHTGETPIECDECSERFKDKNCLRRHKIDHHGLSKFKCKHCDKEFRVPQQLSRHIRIFHEERKPGKGYNCPECGTWRLTESELKIHMVSHMGNERNFACEICGFLTTSENNLKKHKVSHSEVKKHACSYCPKRFRKPECLRDHIRTHTKEKPFQCELCGNAYNQSGALHMHKKAKHPELIKTKLSSGNVAKDLAAYQSSSSIFF